MRDVNIIHCFKQCVFLKKMIKIISPTELMVSFRKANKEQMNIKYTI